ncbi:hypothetical protein CKO28_18830 [Rhodovibrio sodomensis]|uniref:Uncharacterized protein n=1 Tax=Rhodovibrio sodomensis TaxID=1088 RepID=A0ABS1DIR6_9PROT|nr:hypothetical protein [Rhodovibrio sodomensis]MBK1670094.1 hypothetical protein [Rhodovibrio sodomensis]
MNTALSKTGPWTVSHSPRIDLTERGREGIADNGAALFAGHVADVGLAMDLRRERSGISVEIGPATDRRMPAVRGRGTRFERGAPMTCGEASQFVLKHAHLIDAATQRMDAERRESAQRALADAWRSATSAYRFSPGEKARAA